MRRYLARRLAQAVFVLWVAYTVSFALLYLLPSNPVSIMASGGLLQNSVNQAQIDQLKHQYGFDRPVLVQYADNLWHAVQGNLGTSVQTGQQVTSMIAQAAPATVELACAALVLAVIAGVGLALATVYTRWRWLRSALEALPPLGLSLPSFWVGLMLIQVASFRLHLLPAFGSDGIRTLVLPTVTLALPSSSGLAQVFAKSLATAMDEPYVDTAVAKGASRGRVLLRHAARNAALPTLTLIGIWVGNTFAGSVVVETVFSRTGVGRLMQTAVSSEDIPVVQGLVIFGAVLFVVVNLIVDLLYPLLDPQVVITGRGPGAARRVVRVQASRSASLPVPVSAEGEMPVSAGDE